MKNVFTTAALAAALALAAAAARADRAITYHGKLVPTGSAKISTKVPMPMEFRLYREADVGETTALWGRRVSVRFDEGGLFYVELCDGSGTELDRTEYRRLADALASVGGADLWISLTPSGYGELLPRKRLAGVHRVERAECAAKAAKFVAPKLKADTLVADRLETQGGFTVKNNFTTGGGKIVNTIDGKIPVSIGASSGSVIFTDTFDQWHTLSPYNLPSSKNAMVDTLVTLKGGSGYGVASFPVPAGGSPKIGETSAMQMQSFIYGNYNPFP